MVGYIGATSVGFDVTEADIKGDLKSTDDSPEVVLTNTTEEDTDGGRESKITFKGEQSGGELSTLAQIQASHDGTSDDEKGDLIFSTNDGSDGNAPTERMRVDSDGNVGIGTDAPADVLHVKGEGQITVEDTSSGNIGEVYVSNTALQLSADPSGSIASSSIVMRVDGTERMRIDDSGNVGIDTTTPSSKLHIGDADDAASGFRMNNTAGESVQFYYASSAADADFIVNRTGSGAADIGLTHEGNVYFTSGNVGIGTSSPTDLLTLNATTPALDFLSSGTGKATILSGAGGALAFYTGGVFSGSGSERMRITSGGDVGINATSPASQVSGTATVLQVNDGNVASVRLNHTAASSWEMISAGGGQLAFYRNGTEAMQINSSGYLGIGRTPSYDLDVDSTTMAASARFNRYTDGTSRAVVYFRSSSNGSTVGSVSISNSATSYNTSSDYRLKENVTDVTDGITRVKQLLPKRFNFISDPDTTVDGFLAHEAAVAVPEAVTGTHNEVETWTQEEIDAGDAPDNTSAGDNKLDGDGNTIPVYQGIDQSKLVPLLTAALQEAIAKIETLETKVAALESA